MKNTLKILSAVLLFAFPARAVEVYDSVTVHFRQGKSQLDTAFSGNGERLADFIGKLHRDDKDSLLTLRRINIFGAASPEGPVLLNHDLSERRAHAIYRYVTDRESLPDSIVNFRYLGRDWSGLRVAVMADLNVPYRTEVLSLLDEIADTASPLTEGDAAAIRRLQQIGGGAPYRYLYSRLYPALRESGISVEYNFNPAISVGAPSATYTFPSPELLEFELMQPGDVKECRPFYMALKTNLLYDALALPNIGAEFYLGKNLSVVGNWIYGWWDKDSSHRYWRAYGGDIALRWWFGSRAHAKPLTGHHIGLYGGVLTYDFEFGGKGWMGGLPGRSLWARCNRFAGVEYGYSLPIARRLNLDFTIGIGYFGGKYLKYVPGDNNKEYIWQSTHQLKWFGPTKAEISLVWLIGCNNYNRKGGAR
ncbi:MAG: DUF3575 domain-containing protein [Muribaculaceae bacterium]|nr:DUF3575 domain-containing protein [Muribaculaceae bacterium]